MTMICCVLCSGVADVIVLCDVNGSLASKASGEQSIRARGENRECEYRRCWCDENDIACVSRSGSFAHRATNGIWPVRTVLHVVGRS